MNTQKDYPSTRKCGKQRLEDYFFDYRISLNSSLRVLLISACVKMRVRNKGENY